MKDLNKYIQESFKIGRNKIVDVKNYDLDHLNNDDVELFSTSIHQDQIKFGASRNFILREWMNLCLDFKHRKTLELLIDHIDESKIGGFMCFDNNSLMELKDKNKNPNPEFFNFSFFNILQNILKDMSNWEYYDLMMKLVGGHIELSFNIEIHSGHKEIYTYYIYGLDEEEYGKCYDNNKDHNNNDHYFLYENPQCFIPITT